MDRAVEGIAQSRRSTCPTTAFTQQRDHLIISGLCEVLVKLTDSIENRRNVQADNRIGLCFHSAQPFGWSNWNGYDHTLELHLPRSAKRRKHGRACRNAVVHQNCGPSFHRWIIRPPAIGHHATGYLFLLMPDLLVQVHCIKTQSFSKSRVEVDSAIVGDSAHRKFGIVRGP